MSSIEEQTAEVKAGDTMTTDELLNALDRRNCRYVIAIQTEAKNDPKGGLVRVETTERMLPFEAFGLAALINRHCERWLERAVATAESDDEEGT